jgi:hypothetical protein
MKFEDSQPTALTRWIYSGLAAIYFTVCGMLLYFRFVSFQRVVDRFDASGTALPGWFNLVFTVGVGLVLVLLAWRGIAMLRKALHG